MDPRVKSAGDGGEWASAESNELRSKLFLITGIDVFRTLAAPEELMKLLAFTVATATVLAFACPPTRWFERRATTTARWPTAPVGRRAADGSDNRGQSFGGRSQDNEQSAGVKSEKNQTSTEKTGETTIRGRSHASAGLSSQRKHRIAAHLRGHRVVVFNGPRHRFAIHRHGYHLIAFNGPRHRF